MENKTTILSINPGTRYLGVAVFEGDDLIDWAVKVLKDAPSPCPTNKAISVVSRLIDEYQPDLIAMKQTHPSRTSPQLDELCRNLKCLSEEHGIPFQARSIEEIGGFFGDGAKTCSALVAEQVCTRYPALSRLLNRERTSCNHYHSRMFEAVALGVMMLSHQRQTS